MYSIKTKEPNFGLGKATETISFALSRLANSIWVDSCLLLRSGSILSLCHKRPDWQRAAGIIFLLAAGLISADEPCGGC